MCFFFLATHWRRVYSFFRNISIHQMSLVMLPLFGLLVRHMPLYGLFNHVQIQVQDNWLRKPVLVDPVTKRSHIHIHLRPSLPLSVNLFYHYEEKAFQIMNPISISPYVQVRYSCDVGLLTAHFQSFLSLLAKGMRLPLLQLDVMQIRRLR